MIDETFESLLLEANTLARVHGELLMTLSEEFERRYGIGYGEVGCYALIDMLDYGTCRPLSLVEVDKVMRESLELHQRR